MSSFPESVSDRDEDSGDVPPLLFNDATGDRCRIRGRCPVTSRYWQFQASTRYDGCRYAFVSSSNVKLEPTVLHNSTLERKQLRVIQTAASSCLLIRETARIAIPNMSPTVTRPKIAKFEALSWNTKGPIFPYCTAGPLSASGPDGPPLAYTIIPSTYPKMPATATALRYIHHTTLRPLVA